MKHANVLRILFVVVFVSSVFGCTHLMLMSVPDGKEVDYYHGKRTLGALIEDQSIESKIKANMIKAKMKDSHVNVVSFNGIVLLTGEVPEAALKKRLDRIARRTRGVKQVHNQLSIAGPSSYLSRMNDAWLTTKVKVRMFVTSSFPGTRTKVVTCRGKTYIMGLLTPGEVKKAVEIVSRVHGVERIVKVVEYIDEPSYYATTKR